LQGYRLNGEEHVRIEPDAQGGIASEELGITFSLEDGELAMFETATGKRLLSGDEYADEEAARADQERQRAEDAERRLAQETAERKALETELKRLKSGGK
jgi:hypothetical protein